MTTRATIEAFRVWHTDPNITTNSLTTKSQFLKTFFLTPKEANLGPTKSLKLCLDAIPKYWERAGIPIMRRDSALRKMESFLKEYYRLVKNKSNKSESYRVKEETFKNEIRNNIIDIAQVNAKEMMKNQEYIQFLEMQRHNPKSCRIWPVDMKQYRMDMRKEKKADNFKKSKRNQEKYRTKETIPWFWRGIHHYRVTLMSLMSKWRFALPPPREIPKRD
ncbi:UNVERIFIED_CONTAM: hypothetical protein RMT77_017618 [Armadillidium vulgare]